jgi:hypothetical protein
LFTDKKFSPNFSKLKKPCPFQGKQWRKILPDGEKYFAWHQITHSQTDYLGHDDEVFVVCAVSAAVIGY